MKCISGTSPFFYNRLSQIMAAALMVIFVFSCRGAVITSKKTITSLPGQIPIPRMGYTIQVGAFSNLDNAVRLSEELQKKGLDSYYFMHDSGLYKVRCGNFASGILARARAKDLQAKGLIEEFYIVGPDDYPWGKDDMNINRVYLRKSIAQAAKSFIGSPYRLGSESPEEGFDCSGLAMAAYRLNGFELPRTSKEQWATGRPVESDALAEGDLVFFATSRTGDISHVGVYVGNNQFIHAPDKGKKVRVDSMLNNYYKRRYVGAKTYL
ncbi:MAG: C40 family peptidase [Deltaproteobacteria bacterium]|nr:C40 family peptidase [Deltaproteobacteria bacterium]